MATKTFKIGLSTTDKQNMAQDVYERLINMSFDTYNSASVYNEGDFVVYSDVLYRCLNNNVTGTWDATKWEQATFQDLVDDVKGAVAFVNNKANVDGNYPTMTVGVADQLSPYDEESGDDQDEPFSFQATGTGNGTQPDFSTGAIALMEEKQGNTVVVNQQFDNVNASLVNATYSNDVYTFNIRSYALNTRNLIENHKYLVIFDYDIKYTSGVYSISVYFNGQDTIFLNSIREDKKGRYIGVITKNSTFSNGSFGWQFYTGEDTNVTSSTISHFRITDLTQWFNGDIPQDLLDNPENFFRYYQGDLSYNTGELVNANGRYLKAIDRNQWDETTFNGYWDENNNGVKVNYASYIASNDHIKVISGATYYIKAPLTQYYILFYDKDNNFISFVTKSNNTTFTIPTNCVSITWYSAGYGTTYNNDITISIYYDGESGYDEYYPYQVLTNTDTGTEVLRSAGSVKDYKTPDGVVHRLVGAVDLSTLTWESLGNDAYLSTISDLKAPSNNGVAIVGLSSKYSVVAYNTLSSDTTSLQISGYDNTTRIYVRDTTGTPTGTLHYELAEPTTEQGTTYSENLVIDDFGSMDFGGTNGVPQGNLIFYPVDYKAFIDTLYDYTEGTPSNIALKSDLASDKSELQGVDTQLLNAVGGTLRQCLCIKETLDFEDTKVIDMKILSWTNLSGNIFYSQNIDIVTDSKKLISANFATNKTATAGSELQQGQISCFGNRLYVCLSSSDTSVVDGVLLAYEKGE